MDDRRVGLAVRGLRARKGWTQAELGRAAGVSASTASRVERGLLAAVPVGVVRRLLDGLDARLDLVPRWRGGELDRLLEQTHAQLAAAVVARLAAIGQWLVKAEVTFSIYGERGAIDLLAWNREHRALLIVELKSRIDDVGGLLRQVDRYRRLAGTITRDLGWSPAVIGVWVVVADGRTARRRLADHRLVLRTALPADGHEIDRWLRHPTGAISGLSCMPIHHPANGRRRAAATG